MDGADGQSRKLGNLRCGQTSLGAGNEVQQPQSALQGCDVVSSFGLHRHDGSRTRAFLYFNFESADYLMKVDFMQSFQESLS